MLLLLLLGRHGRRCCLRRVWPGTAVDRASFTEVALPLLLLLLLLFLFLLFFFFFFFFFCCCCSSSSFFPTSSLHPPPGGRPTHRLGRFPFRARLGRVRPMASLGLRSRAVSIVASFFFAGVVRCDVNRKKGNRRTENKNQRLVLPLRGRRPVANQGPGRQRRTANQEERNGGRSCDFSFSFSSFLVVFSSRPFCFLVPFRVVFEFRRCIVFFFNFGFFFFQFCFAGDVDCFCFVLLFFFQIFEERDPTSTIGRSFLDFSIAMNSAIFFQRCQTNKQTKDRFGIGPIFFLSISRLTRFYRVLPSFTEFCRDF